MTPLVRRVRALVEKRATEQAMQAARAEKHAAAVGTPQGRHAHFYNAVSDAAEAAGVLDRFSWNGFLLPGVCAEVADLTGDPFALFLAGVYERIGYEEAAANDVPVVERPDQLDSPANGWPSAPAVFDHCRHYAATLPGAPSDFGATQRAGGVASSIALDMQQHSNNLAVRNLDALATEKISALQFDPEAGFMNKKGGDAASALPDYQAKLATIRSDTLGQAPNDAVREQLGAIVGERAQSARESMNRHASGEFNRFQVQSSDNRARLSLQAGAADYRNEDAFRRIWAPPFTRQRRKGRCSAWMPRRPIAEAEIRRQRVSGALRRLADRGPGRRPGELPAQRAGDQPPC